MGVLKEFKSFAMKGNVLDLAVAVIIGGAFGKIITSFVNDVLMPPIGLLLGNTDFSNLRVVIKEGSEAVMNGEQVVSPAVAEVAIKYGAFVNTVLDFLIVAFSIFLVVKAFNKMKKKEAAAPPPAPPAPSKEEVLLTEIRDILKEKK
ncbi:large-conductance mechanosensitive channel protein MscL [Maribellus sp. CM-23]|uniref:large-conductance mechanosensitive channel protein MscL n=1 Tax=Maribellus sp. CM-23 TaxID=2781026 RepID=UPI001F264852|nr:large-conductance mechanosensitive channel protein MscL [Maribellus sp. CM-23]MCE4565972.1 large-conductance mechanosensitive channel protein MscL [Maribellus sp. CM-23]